MIFGKLYLGKSSVSYYFYRNKITAILSVLKVLKSNILFLKSFFKNDGFWTASAMLISKLVLLLVNIYVARVLLKEDLGMVFKAQNFISFFIPFVGLGTYQGLLKYGSQLDHSTDFKNLEAYSLYYGLLGQLVINALVFILALVMFGQQLEVFFLVLWFLVRLVGLFFLEVYKASCRASFRNRKFALLEIVSSVALLALALGLTPLLGLRGYVLALCLSPYFIFFLGFRKFRKVELKPLSVKSLWRFNLSTAAASLMQELFLLTDIFMIGVLFSEGVLAEYKTASLIPLNLIFLSRVFIHNDYPKLCKHHQDKAFIKRYITQYLVLFSALSVLILGLGTAYANEIMSLFGTQYLGQTHLFNIFLGAAVIGMMLRTPFSNLVFAIERTRLHLIISTLSVVLLVLLIFALQPYFGILGVGYAHLLAVFFSGVLYSGVVIKYLMRLR
ncbi:lipopolysaccharide biosynthesis protein [Riemerella anatipestifer]|uniref:lipopolysaccharide biosynthesis protein n=1 Tax=Riemerella anatipestifer TaxID=34085 RepID=UPI0007ECF92E|nr:oligosaccharide flippase family protein [Riemerella anatipestifer]MDR7634734.1 oligosaccharide flippase family protein [Riemerella anatipestifer]MDR7684672.1 oligosaccharide flippase family protein [Riemerella anatipestifer]MDR7733514.1 oligosaccharide flippase family protein [Riemerella anatipestifer]MDR7848033.1 oligosaccharide flippase family protein [Riemerella anatipestifer]MDR7853916.1 oligosaccharide flippase family protein [Riemerella anatipestifer]